MTWIDGTERSRHNEFLPNQVIRSFFGAPGPSALGEVRLNPGLQRRQTRGGWDLRQGPKNYAALVAAQVASGFCRLPQCGWRPAIGFVGLRRSRRNHRRFSGNRTVSSELDFGFGFGLRSAGVCPNRAHLQILLDTILGFPAQRALVIVTSPLWLPLLSSLLKLPPEAYFLFSPTS